MKISALNIDGVLGIQSLHVASDAKAWCFAGPNGSGKTSVAQAIRLCLTGEASRVKLKKRWPALIHDGMKAGKIEIVRDVGECAIINLPSGSGAGQVDDFALSCCLDMHRFATLSEMERRTFLFDLTGVRIDEKTLRERFSQRNLTGDPEKLEYVSRIIAQGTPAAHAQQSKELASRARGAWEEITKERYGSVKAETWAPAEVITAPAQEEVAALQQVIATEEVELASLHQEYGAERSAMERQKTRRLEIERLSVTNQPSYFDELIANTEAELATFSSKLDGLRLLAGQKIAPPPLICPQCEAELDLVHELHLVLRAPPDTQVDKAKVEEARRALPQYQDGLKVLERTLADQRRRRVEAQTNADTMALLVVEDNADKPHTSKVSELADKIERLSDRLKEGRISLAESQRQSNEASRQLDAKLKAAIYHRDVQEWMAIAEALAPDGIPGELLSEALAPINALLNEHSMATGWPAPIIQPDMTVLSMDMRKGGRPYELLSESEQWRADAMLTAAIAQLSGHRIIVLDRFDVLDTEGRLRLIEWVDEIELDTTILLGTTKVRPTLPPSFEVVWLGRTPESQGTQKAIQMEVDGFH